MPGLYNEFWEYSESENSDSESDVPGDPNLDDRIRLLPFPPIELPIGQDRNMARGRRNAPASRNVQPNVRLEIFNGFESYRFPERITGMASRRNELFYLVQWINYGDTSYCIPARVMNEKNPNMVIEYHQKLALRYRYQN